jgi:hypothetical protein
MPGVIHLSSRDQELSLSGIEDFNFFAAARNQQVARRKLYGFIW